jgi:hypothetical protein
MNSHPIGLAGRVRFLKMFFLKFVILVLVKDT